METFVKKVINFRKKWDIEVFVLCSLSLQIVLTFFALGRKKTTSKLVIFFIWSFYLLADWVAIFTLGLLSDGERYKSDQAGGNGTSDAKIMAPSYGPTQNIEKSTNNNNILPFWAPFLLLHLGGPDTITAFSMEDNELYQRHFFEMMFQVGMVGYVFLLSLRKNSLLVPTLFMFVAGIIKCGERTWALYLASINGFQNSMLKKLDPGLNYAKLMEVYQSKKEAGVPVGIVNSIDPRAQEVEMQPQDLDEATAVHKAHHFFKTFKDLVIERMPSFHEQVESRNNFLRWSPKDAFRVTEYELEFIYEVLFTKAAVVHSIFGYILQVICSFLIMVAFLYFVFAVDKHEFRRRDVRISFTLLSGAITLDFASFVMLVLSNWSIVRVNIPKLSPIVSKIVTTALPRDRWSASIMQYNLIDASIPDPHKYQGRIADQPTLRSKALYILKAFAHLPRKMFGDFFREMQYTYCEDVTEDLKELIFNELKKKTRIIKDPKAAPGKWTLEQRNYLSQLCDSVEIEFDESMLMWHVATSICYYTTENTTNMESQEKKRRQLSKLISDYLIYLLKMQPSMMSSSAVIRFLETCAEAQEYFLRKLPKTSEEPMLLSAMCCSTKDVEEKKNKKRQNAYAALLLVKTVAKPIEVKGDWSKSVLFDACILAQNLEVKVNEDERWALISEVWVEMLSYAACECSGTAHAQQLSKGGELLTLVRFLIAHLNNPGPGTAKLIVGK